MAGSAVSGCLGSVTVVWCLCGRRLRIEAFSVAPSAMAFAAGIAPRRVAALGITGRRSGRVISFPVVIADVDGERYLVSMLGNDVNWVRNLTAAGGRAVLRHGRRESVHLEEIEPGARAPILRRYLQVAPGARPHMPVDRTAPLTEFARIAADYPVFRIHAGT
jgi:hypothetical protein